MLFPFKWTDQIKKQIILQRVLGTPGLREVERKIIFCMPVLCNRLGDTQPRGEWFSKQARPLKKLDIGTSRYLKALV